jgi:1,4-alpha-glucan branching enzyme
MLSRMPGDTWQKFANLRAFYGYMWGHPGKKLMFMGCEFAQEAEWSCAQSLDWHLLEQPLHAGVQRLLRDLNRFYRATPALYQRDFSPDGFEWVDQHDAEQSVISFIRRGEADDALILVVCNFTSTVRRGYRVGVPEPGLYRELINTDSAYYGGSNVGTPYGEITAANRPWMGWPCSLDLVLPPLATVFLGWGR